MEATLATFVPRFKRWWTSNRRRQSGYHSPVSNVSHDPMSCNHGYNYVKNSRPKSFFNFLKSSCTLVFEIFLVIPALFWIIHTHEMVLRI